MESTEREALSDLAAVAERAQRALEERPRISIRTRLSVGAAAWFLLTVGLASASIVTISRIEDKLDFTVAVDRYTFEIQQARRFEKNYFLYRTNLPDALEHVQLAQEILASEEEHIRSVIGEAGLQGMTDHLDRYHSLLDRLQRLDADPYPVVSPAYSVIESGLRENGAEMVAVAEDLVNRERNAVYSMLRISQRIPVAFVVVLLFLLAYLIVFFARQILAPLARMMKTAERVANGDFTPITPVRKFHDEFSQLSVAMNHMMIQLAHRHDLLVQAHKLKAVGTLTAGVAHELNNPINNIMLTAASLQEDYPDLDDGERLEMVYDLVGESERAQKIVRNLLDFARESSIESDAIQPVRLVEETLQLATNQIKLAKVKVRGEIDDNLPIIHGDFQQLTQVLLNIVLNALDAMPGGGELKVSITSTRGGDFVSFAISDNGTGIPDHLLGNIFDPFFTTKPGAKGTGLGLSVSLGIIHQHGGDIRVQSEPDVGTTFTVLLPIAKIPAAIPEVKDEELEEDEIPIRGP
jgi:two-component system NtrC family sensor kinase